MPGLYCQRRHDGRLDGTVSKAFSSDKDMLGDFKSDKYYEDKTVTMLFAVDDTIGEANAVKQVGQLVNNWIEQLRIDDDNSQEVRPGVDATTFHYAYNGSVAIENKSIDSHDMGMNLIAVEITRVATLPTV
jgi:hypothetical protein